MNSSEKLVWKHKSIPFYYINGIFFGSSPCIIFLIAVLMAILLDFRGYSDIVSIIVIIPIALIFPFCLLYKWGKYFFILKVKNSKFSIKSKLLAFTKKFNLSEIESIEFILRKLNLVIQRRVTGDNRNRLYIYITINIIDSLRDVHKFNIIRFYDYLVSADTLFIEKKNAMKFQFINSLEDLKHLFPNIVSIRDEFSEDVIFKK